MRKKMNKNLERLYYGLPRPSAFAGADKLLHASRKKINHDTVIEWLESQDAYNRHKLVRQRFPRRHYNVKNIDDLWEMDLMDFQSIAKYNSGYNYVLVVIDVLSKYVWVEAIFNKSAKSVVEAFKKILSRSKKRKAICLQSDKGSEFTNSLMQRLLKDKNIQFRVVRSPQTKAAVAERFIRTCKERIFRYFTYAKTYKYIDVLQKIIDSYNNTKHSAIKMTPASVNLQNAAIARKNLNQRYGQCSRKPPRYKVGDIVRISRFRSVFSKAYEGGWTDELFKIVRISESRSPHVYFLKDLDGEEIDGIFYEEELSRVRKDLNEEIWEIDEILQTKGKGRTKKYFVSWKNWPSKFNSWINARDLKDLQ